MIDQNEQEQIILIPPERLSQEALQALIHEYILREGTDYGHSETPLEAKYKVIRQQLDQGNICITFSTETNSTTLMTKKQIGPLLAEQRSVD